jgi:hypothetical protein
MWLTLTLPTVGAFMVLKVKDPSAAWDAGDAPDGQARPEVASWIRTSSHAASKSLPGRRAAGGRRHVRPERP